VRHKAKQLANDGASASSSHLDASRTPGQMQASAAIVLDANAVVLCDALQPARQHVGPARASAWTSPQEHQGHLPREVRKGSTRSLDASLGRVAAHRPAGRSLCPAQGWASLHRGRDGAAAHVAPAGVRPAPRHPWRVVDQRWPASRPALSGSGSPARLRAPERHGRGAAWSRSQPTGSTLLVGAPPRWLAVAR